MRRIRVSFIEKNVIGINSKQGGFVKLSGKL
jgi:hypothetical protein